MRLYEGRPFALEDHLERLARTCAGLRLPYDEDALRAEIAALLDAAGPVDALLRVVLTRGERRILTVEPMPARPPGRARGDGDLLADARAGRDQVALLRAATCSGRGSRASAASTRRCS